MKVLEHISLLRGGVSLIKKQHTLIINAAEDDDIPPFDLSALEPYLDIMKELTSDMSQFSEDETGKVQEAIADFRAALDDVLVALAGTKDEIIQETQTLKSHNKGSTAYLKASTKVSS